MGRRERTYKCDRLHRHCSRCCLLILTNVYLSGKTLVAKAVATESKLPFLSVKGPELLGSYVGESEANVRSMFDKARQLAGKNHPHGCVLFFDELDSLAPRRGESASGGNVMDRVVATLFSQLDQRAANAPVFCIGATNRPDLLDPALLRPGRFNRLVYLGVARDSHAAIIQAQIGKLRLSEPAGIVAVRLASHLPANLTGADVSAVVSGAVQVAMERLCRRADEQLASALSENGKDEDCTTMTIDDVLATWTEDDLQPTVDFDDFIQAARLVTPSVSQAELERYERLRDTYQTNQKETNVNA
jgi:peroxin-6